MLFEPTTLAAITRALAAALETYGCDPRAVFASAGLDIDLARQPGARFPFARMHRLWAAARVASGDPCIGLQTARLLKPQSLHALGLSWMASQSLRDGFMRIARYSRIANTALRIEISEAQGEIRLAPRIVARGIEAAPEAMDATLAFIVRMCRHMTNRHFAPEKVCFRHESGAHADRYIDFFEAPVYFGSSENALYFDAAEAREPIPTANEEVAREVDRIAERYLATLEPSRVQDTVREILLTLLPSGEADQRTIARNLNRSVSTLQRQLKAEGSSYRKVLDETRQTMAIRLVKEGQHSLGQIAYLLGFSDQANFSRAFRRWTGGPPTAFR